MTLQVDFAVAVGLFLIFIAVLLIYLTSYFSSYTGLMSTSELRAIANNIFNALFGSKGIPEDWKGYRTPVKIGLITDLYRIPVIVTETNSTDRGYITINISLSFDIYCENKTWNSTVRVYNESNDEIPSQLYNQSFCSESYLNSSDIVFNSSFSANQNKTFFVYFSGERTIAAANYSIPFSIPSNFTVKVYPEQELSAISVSRLNVLRNLTYEEVVRTVGTEYEFNIEISE